MQKLPEQVAANIKRIRLSKKLTIQQVADLLEVARITYAKQESGSENLSLETVARIADALDVDVEFLFKPKPAKKAGIKKKG